MTTVQCIQVFCKFDKRWGETDKDLEQSSKERHHGLLSYIETCSNSAVDILAKEGITWLSLVFYFFWQGLS